MKSIKIFFLATVAIVAGLFTACSDDDFKAGPEVDGAQVYFPENVTTQHSISDDVSSIAIPVKRIAKDEALTVAVLASDESGLFTIPSSVSFAASRTSVCGSPRPSLKTSSSPSTAVSTPECFRLPSA